MTISLTTNQIIPASFNKRLLVALIDSAIILCLSYLIQMVEIFKIPELEIMYIGYYGVLLIGYNTTLGGKLLNIYTIKSNGENLSHVNAIYKLFIIFIFSLLIIVCYYKFAPVSQEMLVFPTLIILIAVYSALSLSMCFTSKERSVIDLLSGTRVIYRPKQN